MPSPAVPIPQGKYLPAVRHGDMVFTSGMTPRREGKLLHAGRVLVSDSLEKHRDAVVLACGNALTAARSVLAPDERLERILNMTVFIAAEPGFQDHARLADFASAFLQEEMGDAGIGTRAAVGMGSLPGDATVEIQLVAAIQ